jgi:uncharacterized membrane protein YGL010W
MRTARQWLEEYGESHRHPVNKLLHWVCVPVIVLCVMGFLRELPTPGAFASVPGLDWATLGVVLAVAYYLRLSVPLALGAAPLLVLGLATLGWMETLPWPLWASCAVLFIVAWIGQFIGHAIEGRRPSFFKDLQFLLIGPLWLLADLYRRIGLRPA